MHVIVTTDGSQQSLAAARQLMDLADPAKIDDVTVVAVIRPFASVAFADEVSEADQRSGVAQEAGFREAAQGAVRTVALELEGWGPRVHTQVLSGSPAKEIIRLAKQLEAGLIVIASAGRGLSDVVLLGSTAQRVQHHAPCPVLVARPAPRPR